MAGDQPNTAPDRTRPVPSDADTAARVLDDAQMDARPGGGGLGGSDASGPLNGGGAASGGTAPNSPIDTGLVTGGDPVRDAQKRSLADEPAQAATDSR